MQPHDTAGHSGQPLREVTTVVCMTYADLASMRALEPELAGDHVHLVPGIERDMEGLVMHMLHDAPTVFVVAHSPSLDAAHLEEALVTFGQQRGRNHRLSVVEYDPARPEAFCAELSAAVDAMAGRTATSSAPAPRVHRPADGLVAERSPSRHPEPEVPPAPAFATASSEATSETTAPNVALNVLTSTSPGTSSAEDTFPELNVAVENVRRGQARRRRSLQKRQVRAVALGGVVGAAILSFGTWFVVERGASSPVAAAAMVPRAAPRADKEQLPPGRAPSRAPMNEDNRAVAQPEAAAESRRVSAALDAGQVHALDALLVWFGSGATASHQAARRRCTHLEIAELDGWRLPVLEELRALRRARMLPEGEFWTSTWVDGTSLFVVSRNVLRPIQRSREDDEHVRVVCVRQR